MKPRKTYTLLLFALLVLILVEELNASYMSVYRIRITYVAEGQGVVGEEIYSKTFLLAPNIQGWQHLINYTLYINGKNIKAYVKQDSQGNKYVYPGKNSNLNGHINITLVEYVEVIPPPQREPRLPPEDYSSTSLRQDKYLYLGGFWSHPYGRVTIADLKKLSDLLEGERLQYVYRVVAWVLTNTKYKLGLRGGISYPTEFYSEKEGACGDIHAFITTMLRIKGIPSYLYYAYIYRENASIKLIGQKARYETRNALPHMFSMALLCGKTFPIDLTYPTARDPYSAVRNAGVNTGDRVIILAKIIDTDPNDYLLIYAPSNTSNVEVHVYIDRSVTYKSAQGSATLLSIIALLVIAILALISLLKPSSTIGTDHM